MKSHKKRTFGMKVVGVLLATALMLPLTLLAGCNTILSGSDTTNTNTSSDAYIGVWKATKAEMLGLEVGIAEAIGGNFEIELKAGGVCELRPAGAVVPCTWKATGSTLTISGGRIADLISGGDAASLSATMENGTLVLDDYTGMGLRIIFEK